MLRKLNTLDPKLKEMENVQMKSKGGQLKKMEKIWKGQDSKQSSKSLEHTYFQQPYMGAKDGP